MANKQISKEGTKQNVNLPSTQTHWHTHTHTHCTSRALCLFLWICMGKQVPGDGNQSLTCRYPVRAGVWYIDFLCKYSQIIVSTVDTLVFCWKEVTVCIRKYLYIQFMFLKFFYRFLIIVHKLFSNLWGYSLR